MKNLSEILNELIKQIFSTKALYVLLYIALSATIPLEMLFHNKETSISYKFLFVYILILALIGTTNIYLLKRLYKSFIDLNDKYNIIPSCDIQNLKKPQKINIIFYFIIITATVFSILFFINQSIFGYVFNDKVGLAQQTKICAYICVCSIASFSISTLFLYIGYVVFLNKILNSSFKKYICMYPISAEIFRTIKKENSVVNYIYWFTIAAYVFFVYFHLYVYNGSSLTLQISSSDFQTVWIYIAFVAFLGYFVFFYFPNKLIYDNVLKIKLQTIKEIEEKNRNLILESKNRNLILKNKNLIPDKNRESENVTDAIRFVYDSPAMFNNYFLSNLFSAITTVLTILSSLLQLRGGAF